MDIIEYQEMKVLKQSEKSTVLLVREKEGEQVFVQKKLRGQHPIYLELHSSAHPYLPKLHEVTLSDDTTTIIEEYVEGVSLGSAQLSEKQVIHAVKELCSVLEFLHGKDIIHRDIKPSNIILATDGHIRLIDFDAARMPKEDLEQDTKLLGTRGYAPPEQYGFAQTDARADIYSLGVTLGQLLGDRARKPRYRRIIGKCTNLNPDMRYQSAGQVKKALFYRERGACYTAAGIALIVALWCVIPQVQQQPVLPVNAPAAADSTASTESIASTASATSTASTISTLTVLPAPENPHWNGETSIAMWGNVPNSGSDGQFKYYWRLYYSQDAESVPEVNSSIWRREGYAMTGWKEKQLLPLYKQNLANQMQENGYYYFAVSAAGDGVNYADSPYVMSAGFHYTGEEAPPLPRPTGLAWKIIEDDGQQEFATWSNLDDYAETDTFDVCVYDQHGVKVINNTWSKEDILSIGHGGIWFRPETFEAGNLYRFTVEVLTSRPNEYQSIRLPDPIPEEYFSDWYDPSSSK